MSRFLRDLPFYPDSQLFYFGPPPAKFVSILHNQIPLRVSLPDFHAAITGYAPAINSFPAILDTGFNGGLAMSMTHLGDWAKTRLTSIGSNIKSRAIHGPPLVRGFPAPWSRGSSFDQTNRVHGKTQECGRSNSRYEFLSSMPRKTASACRCWTWTRSSNSDVFFPLITAGDSSRPRFGNIGSSLSCNLRVAAGRWFRPPAAGDL